MKKKTLKRIIIFIIILIALFFLYFFFLAKPEQKEGITKTAQNLFPFGKIVPSERPEEIFEEEPRIIITEEEREMEEMETPRLRQISIFPTSAFEPFVLEREEEFEIIEFDEEKEIEFKKTETRIIRDNIIRYSRISDSNIFETLVTKNNLEQSFLVDDYIPNTEDADFSDDGKHIFFRYWDDISNSIQSFFGVIEKIIPEIIKKDIIDLKIEPCPYSFPQDKPEIGDSSSKIKDVHIFLNNLVPQTRISEEGPNSLGQETDTFTKETGIAVKNFQTLNSIKIDGLIGPVTGPTMKKVCDQIQKEKAEIERNEKQEEIDKDFRYVIQPDIEYSISGSYLPQNITTFSVHPTENKAFYIFEVDSGVIGIVVNLETGEKMQIFESPFTEWIADWVRDDVITLITKASKYAEGYLFALNPNTKQLTKFLDKYNGLTVNVSSDIKNILLSTSNNSSLNFYSFNLENNIASPLNFKTFPEKCVWSSDNMTIYCGVPDILSSREYPDAWYQGLEIFSDSLWKINIETEQTELLEVITDSVSAGIDISQIKIDKEENYLYFTNKRDETLWSYRLED